MCRSFTENLFKMHISWIAISPPLPHTSRASEPHNERNCDRFPLAKVGQKRYPFMDLHYPYARVPKILYSFSLFRLFAFHNIFKFMRTITTSSMKFMACEWKTFVFCFSFCCQIQHFPCKWNTFDVNVVHFRSPVVGSYARTIWIFLRKWNAINRWNKQD